VFPVDIGPAEWLGRTGKLRGAIPGYTNTFFLRPFIVSRFTLTPSTNLQHFFIYALSIFGFNTLRLV
jgi:hypothetical protein